MTRAEFGHIIRVTKLYIKYSVMYVRTCRAIWYKHVSCRVDNELANPEKRALDDVLWLRCRLVAWVHRTARLAVATSRHRL